MVKIRNSVFETNSSSTHSLCVMSKDVFSQWRKGEIWVDMNTGKPAEKSPQLEDEDDDDYYDRTSDDGLKRYEDVIIHESDGDYDEDYNLGLREYDIDGKPAVGFGWTDNY